jgi:predicted RNase H-like HicB family nuclease
MAGTLPHAVFVETGVDDDGRAVAWAAELPGCAAMAATPEEAVAAVPARVAVFVAWLRARGEAVIEPVGNWYEVERVPSRAGLPGQGRAAFSLDDLAPSGGELRTWLGWAELAREELAQALDAKPAAAGTLTWLADQDLGLAASLGRGVAADQQSRSEDPVDRLYEARDALLTALSRAGGAADGVRRAVRLAIADDLRAAELLRER